MNPHRSADEVIEIERRALQALCQGTPEGPVTESAKLALKDYRWRDVMHEALFATIVSLPPADPGIVRSLLPERLTRKGFPDVNWEEFFNPHGLSKLEAENLIRELREFS